MWRTIATRRRCRRWSIGPSPADGPLHRLSSLRCTPRRHQPPASFAIVAPFPPPPVVFYGSSVARQTRGAHPKHRARPSSRFLSLSRDPQRPQTTRRLRLWHPPLHTPHHPDPPSLSRRPSAAPFLPNETRAANESPTPLLGVAVWRRLLTVVGLFVSV